MTKKVNPWIIGTLPRGRHLVYQGILIALFIIAYAIEPKSQFAAAWAVGAASWFFEVKRLHDAGFNGAWSLPVVALWIIAMIIFKDNRLTDDESTAGILALIGNCVGFIVICALPTKEGYNPYKIPETPVNTARAKAKTPVNAARAKKGWLPLHQAVEKGDIAKVNHLIKGGANINARDDDGQMPLHWAAAGGQTETANALIKSGANVFALTNSGHTPLDIAIYEHGEDSEIARILREEEAGDGFSWD